MEKAPPKSLMMTQGQGSREWSIAIVAVSSASKVSGERKGGRRSWDVVFRCWWRVTLR
jgi:hypothetical protein